MARLTIIWLTATLLLCPPTPGALAVDLRDVLSGYGLTSWGQKDGLDSPVNADRPVRRSWRRAVRSNGKCDRYQARRFDEFMSK